MGRMTLTLESWAGYSRVVILFKLTYALIVMLHGLVAFGIVRTHQNFDSKNDGDKQLRRRLLFATVFAAAFAGVLLGSIYCSVCDLEPGFGSVLARYLFALIVLVVCGGAGVPAGFVSGQATRGCDKRQAAFVAPILGMATYLGCSLPLLLLFGLL